MKLLDFCMFMRYNRFQTKKLLHGSTKVSFSEKLIAGICSGKGVFQL